MFARTTFLAALLLALGASSFGPVQAQQAPGDVEMRELDLTVGEQTTLELDGSGWFSVGRPGVVDARRTRDRATLVLVGLRPGETTLLVGTQRHYRIVVRNGDPNAMYHSTAVQVRDNIRLDFYFVQLSTSHNHAVGLSWPTSITANTSVSAALDLGTGALSNALAGVSAHVLPRLDMAQASGWAKVLKKAALITTNGTQADFSGGGEVNVRLSGGFGGSLSRVEFGSRIGVLPRYDKTSGRIELQVTADISDLAADSGTGAPGRQVSTLSTVVNLAVGQALVLAGLSAQSESSGRSGLIGLSQIPILGALFGTNTAQHTEQENVLFIVPTVMDTLSGTDRRSIDEALDSYLRFDGKLSKVPPPMHFSTGRAKGSS